MTDTKSSLSDFSLADISFREAQLDDLDALATLYTHHWCNYVPDLEDKLLAAKHCVLIQLVRSPLSFVAEKNGVVVGTCMGGLNTGGVAPVSELWLPSYEDVHAQALERAKTADERLEGSLFGDQRELEKADAFIATGSPYAEAELNLFMVEPWLIGKGLGWQMFNHMKELFAQQGATRFFLMSDTASNYSYYERQGMKRIWERYDDPDDPDSWGALMYGGEL